jgi:hypothetical protein
MSEEKEGGAEWMQKYWRPAMGWMYMLICMADMIVFPVLWALWQGINHVPITQWNPLTLQGAGLFHIAMGAVIGVSAYGRTQEKLGGANNGGMQFPQGAGTAYIPPTANIQASINTGNQAPATSNNSFGGTTNTFGGSSSGFGTTNSNSSSSGGFGSSNSGFGTTTPATSSFGASTTPASSGFGSTDTSASSASSTPAVTTGFGGKKVLPPADQPAL